ncbi:uncharacterized protein TA06810 [Theileria annulata]|uniref:Galectin n=1 Tax=Theileria annulata TaxID=5874 RepID=Q4UHT3_THEAN|nr:uncharacterized protein TA06810 [Theileria annulata]CAI73356.1 hypothetical protein, conserved [Theileria annulata]|eukprot:XP_954033.1 hypothetical protein, conserved [Theileria annulata]
MYSNRNITVVLLLYITHFVHSKTTGYDSSDSNLIVGSIGFKRLSQITELCEVNNDFLFRTNEVQLRMNQDIFECLSKMKLNGTLKTTTMTSLSVKQWVLWEVDRFNFKDEMNWISGTVNTCGNSKDSFLGGPCVLGPGGVKRFYNHIPEHTEIKITGRVHFFDEWNGESVFLKVNDKILWSQWHNWCPTIPDSACMKFGIDVCGIEYPDRLSVYLEVSMVNSDSSVALEFFSNLSKERNPCDVSWGIDDIVLHIR